MTNIRISLKLLSTKNFFAVIATHHLLENKSKVTWYRKANSQPIDEWPFKGAPQYEEMELLLSKVREFCSKKNFILWIY